MLAREDVALSESTLGRILAKGVRLGRIVPCAFCRGRVTAKKRRTFAKGHAQRWTADTKAARPGANGSRSITCPSRVTATRSRSSRPPVRSANSWWCGSIPEPPPATPGAFYKRCARTCRIRCAPSRSMAAASSAPEFEDACQALNLPLAVLPPKSPQTQRRRRKGKRQLTNRVLEPLRRQPHRQKRQPRTGRIPTLLQSRTAPLRTGLDDPYGIPSPKQASRIRPVSDVVNRYIAAQFRSHGV